MAYDGTGLAGWQKQAGRPTAQAALETALAELVGGAVAVTGAGRTDAGVHATGQVAHFDILWSSSTVDLRAALNACLAPGVVVRTVAAMPAEFHARHSALARVYHYHLWLGGGQDVRAARWSHTPRGPLTVPWMAEAAACFTGVHDFAWFGQPVVTGGTTVRRVDHCEVRGDGAQVVCIVQANAFLRHQVRRMVAALIDVGQGRAAPVAVTAALRGELVAWALGRAPAKGLTLAAVRYPPVFERRWALTG